VVIADNQGIVGDAPGGGLFDCYGTDSNNLLASGYHIHTLTGPIKSPYSAAAGYANPRGQWNADILHLGSTYYLVISTSTTDGGGFGSGPHTPVWSQSSSLSGKFTEIQTENGSDTIDYPAFVQAGGTRYIGAPITNCPTTIKILDWDTGNYLGTPNNATPGETSTEFGFRTNSLSLASCCNWAPVPAEISGWTKYLFICNDLNTNPYCSMTVYLANQRYTSKEFNWISK
jgi:hypothetical protein